METDVIFKALANPVRRQILEWLKHPERYFAEQSYHKDGERMRVCAGQFDQISHLSQSTMSNHLAVLQRAGLITAHKHGQWTYFSRNDAMILQYIDFLKQTL